MVTPAPILAYPGYTQQFFVHTDPSGVGLGAILYQEKDGLVRVLGYGDKRGNQRRRSITVQSWKRLLWNGQLLRSSKTTWPTVTTSKFTRTTTPCATSWANSMQHLKDGYQNSVIIILLWSTDLGSLIVMQIILVVCHFIFKGTKIFAQRLFSRMHLRLLLLVSKHRAKTLNHGSLMQ